MRKYLLYILLILAGTLTSKGQVTFDLNSPVTVQTGQRFRVEFTLSNADGDNFTGPSFDGFSVLVGPTKSQGSSFQSINGKSTSSTFTTWTYILQAPDKECSLKISSATVTAGGKTYTTKSETIDVISGSSQGQGGGTAPSRQSAAKSVKSDDVLLRMDLSSTNVYRGQPIIATLNLYNRVPVSGLDNFKYSALEGFWSQELKVDQNNSSKKTISGKTYEVHPLRQWILYPQKSGSLTIDPATMTAIVAVVVENPASHSGSLFDNMFGGFGSDIEYVNKSLSTGSVKVNVKDLPKPQPDSFDGAVGSFTMESSVSASTLAANSAGSIIIKLKGNGNFPTITDPQIKFPAAFEYYDIKTSDNVTYNAKGGNGERTWEFPFIARVEGSYTIPGVEISYFSPKEGKYKTLTSGDFKFEVTPDNGKGTSNTGTFISGVTKQDLKMLGQDIRYIKTPAEESLKKEIEPLVWSWWYYVILLAVFAAFYILLTSLKKYIKSRSDVAKVKNKKANKVALRRLKKSKGFMTSGNRTKFFEEMLKALWGYMGDKLTIDIANLTKERVREELAGRGIDEEQTNSFLELVSDCEMAQYSPEMGIEMEEIYEKALNIIGNLEIH